MKKLLSLRTKIDTKAHKFQSKLIYKQTKRGHIFMIL
jgi:hypothetical protein